ncbi:MAG: arsenite/tail-anchored protein-transporting ATPase, partial [Actinomycetota bacterium]|nr:arsenite/tail-anchored protein-transporting ATPase [Actinomycetota bacterium]
TGKGGVGKTTVAAGTAALAAARGRKSLVLSTDAAHSLGDAFGAAVGPEPTEIDTGLYVQQVDPRRRFERSWREIQDYLLSMLSAAGVDPIEAEELTVLPGAEEVLALLEVRDQARSGLWDLVVVDCAPTAETLRLLALPDALGWYMDRVFPIERRIARSLRPVLGRVAGVPMPRDRVFDAVAKLHDELREVRAVLTGPSVSVRLVLTPEAVVVAEARRTLTSLCLYGYRVDGVVANRVFPEGGDAWRAGWVRAQAAQLAEVEASFAPLPVHRTAYGVAEPVGAVALAALAQETYGEWDPFAEPTADEPVQVERSGEELVLSLALPLASREATDLTRVGDELVVTVGAHRRVLALPSALRRCQVAGARLVDGRLRVRFEPDPDQWRPL